MCLISTEIEKVSNTKILVSPNYNLTRQLTVYSNFVNNLTESNAMVLPVPLPKSIQFIDLSGYKNIFEDCASCFYNPNASKSLNFSSNSYGLRGVDSTPLEVFNVGSYKVSLAMNLEQISRVDSRVFELSEGLANTLSMFYYQPYWGFIICKLDLGAETYHPFAYSHDIIDKKVYIPTRHYHQEVAWSDANAWALGLPIDPKHNPLNSSGNWNENNIDNSPMFRVEQFGLTGPEANGWQSTWDKINGNGNARRGDGNANPYPNPNSNNLAKMSSRYDNLKKLNESGYKKGSGSNGKSSQASSNNNSNTQYKEFADDWSHTIYLLNLNPNSNQQLKQMNTCREIWDTQSLFDPEKINFDFGRCYGFSKVQIDGTHPNIDLVIPIPVSTSA